MVIGVCGGGGGGGWGERHISSQEEQNGRKFQLYSTFL